MTKWITIKTWPQSPAVHVNGGTRYTKSAGQWVEIGAGASVADDASLGEGAIVSEGAIVGAGARVGELAHIGERAHIGDGAHIAYGVRLGDFARVCDGACVSHTPVYTWPQGGDWPVYVADQEKRLVGIGCEVHPIEFWINGGADKIREKRGVPETAETYDEALRYVARAMRWEDSLAGVCTD